MITSANRNWLECVTFILKYRYWVRKINCPVFCLIPFVYFKSKRFIIGVK